MLYTPEITNLEEGRTVWSSTLEVSDTSPVTAKCRALTFRGHARCLRGRRDPMPELTRDEPTEHSSRGLRKEPPIQPHSEVPPIQPHSDGPPIQPHSDGPNLGLIPPGSNSCYYSCRVSRRYTTFRLGGSGNDVRTIPSSRRCERC